MTTAHLTDAQRDTFAACGLIVIDGEARRRMQGGSFDNPHVQWNVQYVAPEGWRILTEPCPTCGGTGKRYFGRLRNSPGCPNPDCVGGRRVVTLTVTCRWCEAKAINHPHKEAGHEGVVTLGRFTIPALLPVEKHRIGGWRQKTEGESWVYLYDEREATGYLDQLEFGGSIPARAIQFTMLGGLLRRVDLRLDPLPQPGQFIARPEAVPI